MRQIQILKKIGFSPPKNTAVCYFYFSCSSGGAIPDKFLNQ